MSRGISINSLSSVQMNVFTPSSFFCTLDVISQVYMWQRTWSTHSESHALFLPNPCVMELSSDIRTLVKVSPSSFYFYQVVFPSKMEKKISMWWIRVFLSKRHQLLNFECWFLMLVVHSSRAHFLSHHVVEYSQSSFAHICLAQPSVPLDLPKATPKKDFPAYLDPGQHIFKNTFIRVFFFWSCLIQLTFSGQDWHRTLKDFIRHVILNYICKIYKLKWCTLRFILYVICTYCRKRNPQIIYISSQCSTLQIQVLVKMMLLKAAFKKLYKYIYTEICKKTHTQFSTF